MNMNQYEAGQKITQNRETFVLMERTGETFPTSQPFALVRWRVAFNDRYNQLDTKTEFYRAVREYGTANTHLPDKIPGLNYVAPVEGGENFTPVTIKVKKQDGRGRPAIGMNELKAKNVIRDYKQWIREENDPLVVEAFEFLLDAEQENYLEKHFKRGPKSLDGKA